MVGSLSTGPGSLINGSFSAGSSDSVNYLYTDSGSYSEFGPGSSRSATYNSVDSANLSSGVGARFLGRRKREPSGA